MPRPQSTTTRPGVLLTLFALVLTSCGTEDRAPDPVRFVSQWGSMREVLRDGATDARVSLDDFTGDDDWIGVGALDGLAGEVTIVDGHTYVAVSPRHATPEFEGDPTRPIVATGRVGASATLLFAAQVDEWVHHSVGSPADYDALEATIAQRLSAANHPLDAVIPVRIRGRAPRLVYHVIDGACPIANPDGTPPFRHEGAVDTVELVGFFVAGAAGRITHHGRRTHLHVIAEGHSGHLEEVALENAVLLLPAHRFADTPPPTER